MTHTPSNAKSWPRAGANDEEVASGEQIKGETGQRASDLPSAAADPNAKTEPTPPLPEAKPEGKPERGG